MTRIICATRAGEGSRAVQMAAIQEAKDTGLHLVFLYVIESRYYEALDEAMRPFVRAELYWLAKTLLRIADNRAKTAGVYPDMVTREGHVREEIAKFVKESPTSLLFLGAPRHHKSNTFNSEAINSFALELQDTTCVPVRIVQPPAQPINKLDGSKHAKYDD